MTTDLEDLMAPAQAVADALLYEGYLLYPYRASAAKNRVRWQFGVLVPPAYAVLHDDEHPSLQTECLFEVQAGALLHVRVRFLQLVTRPPAAGVGAEPAWDEAVPREIDVVVPVPRLFGPGWRRSFTVPGGSGTDPGSGVAGCVTEAGSGVAGYRQELTGELWLRAEPVPGPYGLLRLRAEVSNTSPGPATSATRDEVLRHSLVATHTLLALTLGRFQSLIDPPEFAVPGAEACQNLRTWPVLVGDPGQRNTMLSAPIILYDYPAVAPESPGDFFDSTEIDELLSLRTLTLTEEEKRQARATDRRAAELIDRVENMPPEVLAKLHGAIRSLRPAAAARAEEPAVAGPEPSTLTTPGDFEPVPDPRKLPAPEWLEVNGVPVAAGSRVRLLPDGADPAHQRTDAQDMFLIGRTATVREVLQDVDGGSYLAVTLDDDPGADLHAEYGRYRYFGPDEVTPLPTESTPASPQSTAARVLVAGVGNIFLGDDAFGVELARRLAEVPLPAGVRVADYGIGGVHLAYDLLNGYDVTILLDATPRGEAPGTVSVLSVETDALAADPSVEPAGLSTAGLEAMDAHGMQPDRVLALVRRLGGDPGRVLVVGCEPGQTGYGMGLSEPVAAAVARAVPMVQELIAEQLVEVARDRVPAPALVGEEGS